MTHENSNEESVHEQIESLTKKERRVLGTLIEKSLTTPEYYPLTNKALANGCNQKSNRSPLSSYDQYDVEEILEGLKKRGLVAFVQTAGGRTERYRHLLRDVVGWNNARLAIMGELLLRGKQQLGELRSRASRMSAIESLGLLRQELQHLMNDNYVLSSGDLQRRGIEVDHALYTESEQAKTAGMQSHAGQTTASEAESPQPPAPAEVKSDAANLPVAVKQIDYRDEFEELKNKINQLEDRVTDLERQLGG